MPNYDSSPVGVIEQIVWLVVGVLEEQVNCHSVGWVESVEVSTRIIKRGTMDFEKGSTGGDERVLIPPRLPRRREMY